MKFIDFILFLPEIFLLNFTLIFLWVALYLRARNYALMPRTLAYYSILLCILTLVLVLHTPSFEFWALVGLIHNTSIVILWKVLLLLFSAAVFLIISTSEQQRSLLSLLPEIIMIRLIVVFSLMLLVSTENLIIMFFALELYSLAAYILVSQRSRTSVFSSESGVKYFITGTTFSLLLIYGIGLLYNTTGLTTFSALLLFLQSSATFPITIKIGLLLILSGLLFKISSAPFHFWSPDVYEGSPTTTMFFLSTIPKIALVGVLIKFLPLLTSVNLDSWLFVSATLSVIIGSIGGLYQKRLKRLLAYSAINNTGFILLSLINVQLCSKEVVVLYLVAYLLSLLGIFNLLLSNRVSQSLNSIKNIAALSNLFFVAKTRAIALSILLFSSAGLPPFIGFLSKFLVLLSLALTASDMQYMIILCLLCSPLSVFYYIRILKIMAFSKKNYWIFFTQMSRSSAVLLSLSVVLTIVLFCTADSFLNFINNFV